MRKTLSKSLSYKVDGGGKTGDRKRRYSAASHFHTHLPRGEILPIRKPWRANFHSALVVAIFWLYIWVGIVVEWYIYPLYRGDILLAFAVCRVGVCVADRVVGGDFIPTQRCLVGGVASF